MQDNTWWIECGAFIPNGNFTRNHLMEISKKDEFRFKWHNKGVFTTAYIYDSKERANANLDGDFYLDLDYDIEDSEDKEKSFDIIRNDAIKAVKYIKVIFDIDNKDIRIYFSGSKGIHLIVPKEYFNVQPHKNLNMIFRLMAEDIKRLCQLSTIDLRVYDKVRLWRMPNSKHQKTGFYKVPLTFEELTKLSFDNITQLADAPRSLGLEEIQIRPLQRAQNEYRNYVKKLEDFLNKPKFNGKIETTLNFVPPCIEYLLNNQLGKGQRNDTTALLASFLRQSGYKFDEVVATLLDWNDKYVSPAMDEREIKITVESIFKGQHIMGCTRAKMLSQCGGKECKLYKQGD
jgi:hypothetical protein